MDQREQEVIDAASQYDRNRTEQAADELIFALDERDFAPTAESATKVLKILKNARYFDLLESVAEAYRRVDTFANDFTSLYVQSLIEQKRMAKAIQTATLARDRIRAPVTTADDRRSLEKSELIGLLGRAYKQKYVDHHGTNRSRASNLVAAIGAYRSLDPELWWWHGVNAVACVARAARDGVAVPEVGSPGRFVKETAEKIRAAIESVPKPQIWNLATAFECSLAVSLETDDPRALAVARRWLERYVTHPDGNAFEYNSTLRQLVEVWQLKVDAPPGDRVLPVLEGELLRHDGAFLEFVSADIGSRRNALRSATDSDVNQEQLQAQYGVEGFVRYTEWKHAEGRAYWICKIHEHDNENSGMGTGFLIRGKELADWLDDKYYVLTNDHVVSDDPAPYTAQRYDGLQYLPLAPSQAFVSCELDGQTGLEVARVVSHSPYLDLDFSLLELMEDFAPGISNVPPLETAQMLPPVPRDWRQGQRLYVIHHPKGADLAFSMSDNFIMDHEGPPDGKPSPEHRVRVHYRSPTAKGSSGSPVFNREWHVVALHHAGGQLQRLNGKAGKDLANEGIWIGSVRQYLANNPTP